MSARVRRLKRQRSEAKRTGFAAELPTATTAKLVASAGADGVWVELGTPAERVLARVALDWEVERLARAVELGLSAVLAFEDGDPGRPIVMGILGGASVVPATSGVDIEADADGRRVRLNAREEIILKCGQASITLRANGSVVIRGSYLETHATGTNRIKGGSVRIN
jgi:hypothetical protein